MKRSSAGLQMSSGASTSLLAVVLLFTPAAGWTQDAADGAPPEEPAASGGDADSGDTRALGGTSVIGNRELPKSLYIVPWKNSRVGERTDLSRDLLDEGLTPVDPQEFERQVQYHQFHQQQQ